MKFSTAYPTARLFNHVAMAANTIPLHCQTDRFAKILIEKTQSPIQRTITTVGGVRRYEMS